MARGASFRNLARGGPSSWIGEGAIGIRSTDRGISDMSDTLSAVKTVAIGRPSAGVPGVIATAPVGEPRVGVAGTSGSSRARPTEAELPEGDTATGAERAITGTRVLSDAGARVGKIGCPKNFATPNPTAISADAKKIF